VVKYAERAPGVYRAKFLGVTDREITDRQTGEVDTVWLWRWQETADPTTVGELDTITSRHFKARSNALRIFTGMLGRPPTGDDDTDNLIGQEFDVVYGPNQSGKNTVTGATRPAPTALPAAAASTASDGPLPF
jgi:hypothetical protein